MRVRIHQTLIGVLCVLALSAAPVYAGEVAKASLDILGLGLEVDRNPVVTAVDIPASVQTIFGGKTNDDAPAAPGLSAIGELTGPGIVTPITLVATPGRAFALPALHEKGEYTLSNIRLTGAGGEFLQQAVPSFAAITVADVLKTEVRVRQLTAEELRERGIVIDSRNYEVYEYTFVFGVDQTSVTVPYPVIVDKRTHVVVPVPAEKSYTMPAVPTNSKPPRFSLPDISPFQLGGDEPGGTDVDVQRAPGTRPSIPAALVIPNGFGVLHQFFAVILQVENAAPAGSNITLDSVTATINSPLQLRVAKVMPAVALGQPVTVTDEVTGRTFLVAGGRGSVEWALEALKTGTHTVNIDVRATYQKPGQDDIPMRGRVSASLVVSDPRFQINFSHPDTVRKDEKYTAYAFVTNLSPQRQHVQLDLSHIPACSSGAAVDNICREAGEARTELDLEPGEMKPVPYKLTSKITGKIFAAAGVPSDEVLGVSMQLTMGVSASGLPLSPATLIMPWYAQFLPPEFVDANMQFLGLAYGLATAPLNQHTAKFPRVIKQDVFFRAQQIARAGQRIFITRAQRDVSDPLENREAFFHLALDLLGNPERVDQRDTAPDLREWDDLRQMEESGRRAGAAMARQLERNGFSVDAFAAATSHRTPFLFAYAHGAAVSGNARPYVLSVKTGSQVLDVPAEAETGWIRTLPYSELTALNAGGSAGELAMIGRWRDADYTISVIPATSAFTLDLLYPDQNGTPLRTDISITNATPGVAVELDVRRGARTLIVRNATATPLVDPVPQTPLRVIAAAQDLHLDADGHLVSLLFNRPLNVTDAKTLRDRFALTVDVAKASYSVTRRNGAGAPLQIPGAALQEDAKIITVTFDKTLSKNAQYKIAVDSLADLVSGGSFSASNIVPRVDNDRPGAILTGKVLRGDNTPIENVLVRLDMTKRAEQIDVSGADGRFLYEFIPRDIDSGIFGDYVLSAEAESKKTSAEGSVRLPGEVHTVNLVFLGRGRARGQVRYSDGEVIPNTTVTIGSSMFSQFRRGRTDAAGNFDIGDLPVGPLTFSVVDKDGRPTFAANHIRTAGEVITQDLVIERKEFPGTGTIRVTVKRSDTNANVVGAHVGVWMQDYALRDGYSDAAGAITFSGVPAGLVSILASDFGISRTSAGIEVELRKDQTLEQTIVISVPTGQVEYATLDGTITRDDPTAPGDATKDQPVAGAIVSIAGLPAITANADGTYLYADVPLSATNRRITVFDPATGRRGYFTVPTLVSGANRKSMRLRSTEPDGFATMRVRLYGARGESVSGYRVIAPGYPPEKFVAKGGGVYELANVRVPQAAEVVAVPENTSGDYGEQAVRGKLRVDFAGQLGITDLRLPGAGTVVVRTEVESPCSTPPCYSPAIGAASLMYRAWDEAEQNFMTRTITADADPVTGLVTFTKVPARQELIVATSRNPLGYATAKIMLAYDGDAQTVALRLKTIGDVTGRVLSFDRITPVANATVRIFTDRARFAPAITGPDGSFRFPGIAANTAFRIVADLSEDGVYRTGRVDGKSPVGGGPVNDLLIVMREQATVEGQVVDGSGAAMPLARYWLRELAWPYRTFGTPQDPLFADIGGRFVVANVFTGAFRITAVSPEVQETRGDYQGTLAEEGDVSQREVEVRIGGAGVGAVSITVVDPQLAFTPVANAEVALLRNDRRFDFATTNDNGVVFFDDVPAGTSYQIHAFSKSAGRAGNSPVFTISADHTSTATVHLEFRGTVSGTLTDPESEPVAGAAVKGMPITLNATGARTADSTDALGAFEFIGVPEGPFTLSAFEGGTHRHAVGPTNLFISKLVPEQRNIHLELERTGTLTVNVHLPTDTGGAGQLAPLAEVTVWQGNLIYGPVPYYRGLQGNPLTFRKLLRGMSYGIEVRELGGESRVVKSGGSFAAGSLTATQNIVLPTSGTVEVRVVDGAGKPVEDARVRIRGRNTALRTLYTPASGIVTLPGLPLGWVSVDGAKNNVTASAGGNLVSRSQPLQLTMNLGTNAMAEGFVDAEIGAGMPSAGTRVVLVVTTSLLTQPLQLETLTDAMGAYRFTGIPVKNTSLALQFYGPDDTTIGATRTVPVSDGTTGTITIARVKLDGTPPRVLSIDPPANATNVSPTASIYVTFSEQIAASYLTNTTFKLLPTDGSAQVSMTFVPSLRPDGTYLVRLTAPAPLKSNVLYRLSIPSGIKDTTGNPMKAAVGTSFTTVNYTEPAVVRVDPPETLPIPEGTTFRIKFNKAIDETSFEPGQGGLLKFDRLDSYKGTAVETIAVARFVDPADPTTLVVAPSGVAIAESAFYRITVSGTRDTQTPPNTQSGTKVLDFFSFDLKKPVVAIVSPAGELVSGVLYAATVGITDSGTGSPSSDVAYVDWLSASGSLLARVKTKPFTYSFVAPATSVPATFTLKASATDLSGNTSVEPGAFTWNVAPNEAPRDVVVTHTPASVYPSGRVTSRVRFVDEGLSVTVAIELRGTNADGTPYARVIDSKKITRTSTAVAFAEAVFTYDVPVALKDGAATLIATATDSVNKSASGQAELTILADTAQPVFVSVLPKAETHYQFNQTFTVELQVKDAETGVARAIFKVNGAEVFNATSGTFNATTGVTTFKKTITVPPKNADTRIPIVITALDNKGNITTDTREVIYDRVNDETLPRAAWLSPLDGAALPSNQTGWLTTLRVRATDDTKVTAVRFESPALAAPVTITTPKSGTTDIFETKAALTMPAAPFTITAIVSDGDPSHDVELPITVDPIVAAPVITTDFNISSIVADQYANQSVLVRGAKVYITVPITLKDLILVDGATLSNPEEQRLDVTITDHLFVDADSKVDVSGKGYLGGLRKREDNSFTNTSLIGRTLGGTTTGGATNADASHAGLGGWLTGTTNTTYGSIAEPLDFGAGGSGTGTTGGGNGGGAVALRGASGLSRFVLAGSVRANGTTLWTGGAGGSVLLISRALITSPLTRVTANGGDEGASDQYDAGGGGGRVAVRVSERFDVDPTAPLLQAHGGRNGGVGGNTEGANYIDGGAGTVFLATPESTLGTLIVSAFDERYPATTHRSGGTPLGGTLEFDGITIGPRALARFDTETSSAIAIDPTAQVVQPGDIPTVAIVSTTPAAGGDVIQTTSIARSVTASSAAGIRSVRTILSVQPTDVVTYPKWPSSIFETAATIVVPSPAPAGPATLRVRVTDRAGRVAESAPLSFNVVANTAPAIQTFEVMPAETYANRAVAVSATAADDLEVKTLTLAASSPATVSSQTATNPTPTTMARQFTVNVPVTALSGSEITLTLSTTDDFPSRAATTATKIVRILTDTIAPAATIVKPLPEEQIQEATGATFVVEVDASDAEVAVKRVSVTFEGVESDLALVSGSIYRKTLTVPSVDGNQPVAKSLVVKATDYDGNTTTRTVAFFVKPLFDERAPILSWLCSSPDAMYPPGYEIALRVKAEPVLVNGQLNGVNSITVSINGAAPIAAARIGSTNDYEAKYTIPGGTSDGTKFSVRIVAIAASGSEATLLGELTSVSGLDLSTASTIEANDTAFENQSYIVRAGGTLTVIGAHRLKNIVLIGGGKLVTRPSSANAGEVLTVDKLYVSCSSAVDASGTGYTKNLGYPGIAGASDSSGGGHIGAGGFSGSIPGDSFGNVYRPIEWGGGGAVFDKNYTGGMGGGAIRMHADASIVVDGAIRANGFDNGTWGAGAGGSVWITTPGFIGGAGSIEARGGGDTNNRGAGGGGAIALEYGALRGTIAANLIARGGKGNGTSTSAPGAPGTIYLKGPQSVFGELTIDNIGVVTAAETELPYVGNLRVTNVAADGAATVSGIPWLPAFVAGNWVRVVAPDGTVRGTWRIAGVSNSDTIRTAGYHDIWTTDSASYSGYIFWSDTGYPVASGKTKKLFAARNVNGTWEWDNNTGGFVAFAPKPGDAIVATFTKTAQGITRLEHLSCAGGCATILGIPTREIVLGSIGPNISGGDTTGEGFDHVGGWDPSELQPRGGDGRGVVISDGSVPKLTLEAGADVRAGDTLRGVYRFDSLEISGAKVYTADLLEVTTTPALAASTLVTGNLSAPVVDASKITFTRNLHGVVLTGTAGAVTDADGTVALAARNTTKPVVPYWPDLTAMNHVSVENAGGAILLRKIPNGNSGGTATTLAPIADYGWIEFRSGRTDKAFSVKLTGLNHGFSLSSSATYQVVANNSNVSGKSGSCTGLTRFRVELLRSVVRWYVDGTKVHEVNVTPASRQVVFGMPDDAGAVLITGYDPTFSGGRAVTASDGSFSMQLFGAVGEPFALTATDRNRTPETRSDVAIGAIGSDAGIASVTFAQPEVPGGRTVAATVTLNAPAPADGALILLSTDNSALITIPSTVTVTAGSSTATVNVVTKPVTDPVNVAITAVYGRLGATGTLRLVKDTTPPVVTITAPVANAQITEGAPNTISVSVTADDADSGVAAVVATLDGVNYNLTKSGSTNVWNGTIPSPYVSGSENVAKQLVVTATDNTANTGSSSVTVQIKPVVDSAPPTISYTCSSTGAMYPASYTGTLRVVAKAPSTSNRMHKVELIITDPAGATTTIAGTLVGTDLYDLTFTVPSIADRSLVTVRALATTTSGTTAASDIAFRVVAGGSEIKTSVTISATDTTYENKAVVVYPGTTVTIDGAHTFDRLVVLPTGNITHAAAASSTSTARVDITAASTFIACGGLVDVSSRGYAPNVSYPGSTINPGDGGSHMGLGGNVPEINATYGSVHRPLEHGAGEEMTARGGGVVRLRSTESLVVDGNIRANGGINTATSANNGGGAGGSAWIIAGRISGFGSIEAKGGRGYNGGGGGGAVAVEYSESDKLPTLSAVGETHDMTGGMNGGPGTVYVKGPDEVYGILAIDPLGRGVGPVQLPGLGSGLALATSGSATLVTDRASDIPPYFEGHWVRITTPAGTVKGTWRIATINARTVTLAPNGNEAINIAQGDSWTGLYRFDELLINGVAFIAHDPVESTDRIISGTVTTANVVTTHNLHVTTGATLRPAGGNTLTINAPGEVRVDGVIDVNGLGYLPNQTYPDASPINSSDGGSHVGRGGRVDESNATYGSVYRPQELGAGDKAALRGGGAIRIAAGTLIVNGAIRANGMNTTIFTGTIGGGGGGSVWITTTTIGGTGSIEADGGNGVSGGGGGGAVAIEYTDATSTLPSLFARGGGKVGTGLPGGPGTTFVKGPAAAYGNVTIDFATRGTGLTDLPNLGNGLAASGSGGTTLVTDRAANIPTYFAGHWVQIADVAGNVKGTWKVSGVNLKTITLASNGADAPNVAVGDRWRGVYRFDTVKLRGANVQSLDGLLYATLDKDTSPLAQNSGWPRFAAAPVMSAANVIAGTVLDNEQPVKLIATNTRTGVSTPIVNAAPDGSFAIAVTGDGGDTFTVTATDTNAFPLSSRIAATGAIATHKLVAFIIEPEILSAGEAAVGTVRINEPAAAGGTAVAFTSSDPAVLSVPATVVVPAGKISTSFPVTAGSPSATTNVTIEASLGRTDSAVFTVVAASGALSALTLSAPIVEGGTSVTGTVTLGAAAPAGGAWIALFTTDAALASLPDYVFIGEGNTSTNVTIETSRVAAASRATITALFGATKTATLDLTACSSFPSPEPISGQPSTVWFDDEPRYFPAAAGTRSWTFTGAAPLNVAPDSELVLHLLTNPCNPPREVLVTWSDGTNSWTASWGESRMPAVRFGAMPHDGGWARLESSAKALGIDANVALTKFTVTVDGGEAWVDVVGAKGCSWIAQRGYETAWNEIEWAADGSDTLTVHEGEVLFAYIVADPCDPPREVLLQWTDGVSTKSAFWGDDAIAASPRVRAGLLPASGTEVRLEIAARALGLEGATLTGMTLTAHGGAAELRSAGKYDRANLARAAAVTQSQSWLQLDLGNVVPIDEVVVLDDGLRDFSILASDVPFTSTDLATAAAAPNVSRFAWTGPAGPSTIFKVLRTARYIRLQLSGSDTLDAPELQVWAAGGYLPVNYAAGMTTSAPGAETLEVDLDQVRAISTIELLGGAQDFYLFVSDAPFASADLAPTLQQSGVRAYHFTDPPSAHVPIHHSGRYIRVQKNGTGAIGVSDIRVWSQQVLYDALSKPRKANE